MGKILSVFLMIVFMVGAASPAPEARGAAQDQPVEYLLVLELPQPESLDVTARLNPVEARRAAAAWAKMQAQPVLEALGELQARGEILAYAFDPQAWVVRVELSGTSTEALDSLPGLRGVADVLSSGKNEVCQPGYSQALAALFLHGGNVSEPVVARPDITDPSIFIYVAEGDDYSYVRGNTTPSTAVTLSVARGTALLFSASGMSDTKGSYQFFPSWISDCTASGYSWQLLPDDVVTVSAHGSTVSTTVVRLTAWIDPEQNALVGSTAPGRSLLASMAFELPGDPCKPAYAESMKAGVSSADGSFLVDFSTVDVPFGAWGSVEVYDANHNMTWSYAYGFWMQVDVPYSQVSLSFLPNAAVELVLERAGESIETLNGLTAFDGWYNDTFSSPIQPEDVIRATSLSETMAYTVAPFSLVADPETDWISGTTAPNLKVVVDSEKPGLSTYYYYSAPFPLTCNFTSACMSITSDGAGAFGLLNPFDLGRGDALEARVLDGKGNWQSHLLHIPLIAARLAYQEVLGYWVAGNAPVQVDILDAGGEFLSSTITTTYGDGYFEVNSPALAPGYQIRVQEVVTTTQTTTLTLATVVPAFTAQTDAATNHLTGSAPASRLLLDYSDYQPASNAATRTCLLQPAFGGGGYDFDLGGYGIEAGDQSLVYSQGADGHITEAFSHALQVSVEVDSGFASGYVPLPNSAVTVVLMDPGGTVIEGPFILPSSESGFYYHTFATKPLVAGHWVKVTAGTHEGEVHLPVVTVGMDSVTNRIFGLSAPLQPGVARLYQWYTCDGNCARSLSKRFTADGAGIYAVSFQGLSWWDCTRVVAGSPCTQARMFYNTVEEHVVSLNGPKPSPAPADAYEDDNTFALAKPFEFASQHTFHNELDMDWVALGVTDADLGKTYIIETTNLGLMEDTVLWLYDVDGITDLDEDDDGGVGAASRIEFTPASAGTYYVQVLPYDPVANTGNCGSTYTLRISTAAVYFPVVNR